MPPRRGEAAPGARLLNRQAKAARERYAREPVTIAALAAEYGVSYATIWRIIKGLTYREDGGQAVGIIQLPEEE